MNNPPTENGVWKFVRVNGEYRWTEGMGFHTYLVNEGETAEAAGIIFTFDDFWRMENGYSTSLKVACDLRCYEDISKLLGKPHDD